MKEIKSKRRSRGRPTHTKEEIKNTMNAILQSAINVFERKGDDIPVEEILDEAKISRGTFYKYFPSKTKLREELLIFSTSRFLSSIEKAIVNGQTERDKIESGIDAFLTFHTKSPVLYRACLRWALAPGTTLHRIRVRTMNLAADLIARELEQYDRPTIDPLVYQILVGAIETASIQLLEGEGPVCPKKVERVKAVLLRIIIATLANEGDTLPHLPTVTKD